VTAASLEEERRWAQARWPCSSCGTDIDGRADVGYLPARGGLCATCERTRRETEAPPVDAEEAAHHTGILARLRRTAHQ
jgi:hypothetical protein